MKVLILTAGKGSRLGLSKPKSLVELNVKRLIDYQLIELTNANISLNDIYLITGYKNEMFREFDLKTFFNPLFASTNQIYSITCANEVIDEEEVLIIYGDILFKSSLINDLKKFSKNIVVPSYSGFKELWEKRGDTDYDDLESFKKDSAGILKEIGDRVIDIKNVNGQFMGVIYFRNYYFEYFLNQIEKFRIEYGDEVFLKLQTTEFLSYLIKNNTELFSFDYSDFFIEIDNKTDLEIAKKIID